MEEGGPEVFAHPLFRMAFAVHTVIVKNPTYTAFALCSLGLERTLLHEVERLGLEPRGRSAGRVFFAADAAGLFRANLWLRTAERVLVEVARFRATNFDELFEGARTPEWERFLRAEDRLVIERVRSGGSRLAAQTSIQAVVHKAAYERLGAAYGLCRLPESGIERSARVYLDNDECIIGLDTSGDALHKRGYRRATGVAPLKETVAAGMLFLAGWNRRLPLLDPFCGAGTILIEAALFGLDRAPGLGRSFSLETMPLAEKTAFAALRDEARARVKSNADLLLVGTDIDEAVLSAARANAERAGVAEYIQFRSGRAEDAQPLGARGVMLTNPPYGERIGTEEAAKALFRSLAPLKDRFHGWGLGFVTNRSDFGGYFGLRAVAERRVMNGAEEQWFHWYPAGYETRAALAPRNTSPASRHLGRTERGERVLPAQGHEDDVRNAEVPRGARAKYADPRSREERPRFPRDGEGKDRGAHGERHSPALARGRNDRERRPHEDRRPGAGHERPRLHRDEGHAGDRRDRCRREGYSDSRRDQDAGAPRRNGEQPQRKPRVFRIEPERSSSRPPEPPARGPQTGTGKPSAPETRKSGYFGGARGPGRIDRNKGK